MIERRLLEAHTLIRQRQEEAHQIIELLIAQTARLDVGVEVALLVRQKLPPRL